jgi:hypothetical protein
MGSWVWKMNLKGCGRNWACMLSEWLTWTPKPWWGYTVAWSWNRAPSNGTQTHYRCDNPFVRVSNRRRKMDATAPSQTPGKLFCASWSRPVALSDEMSRDFLVSVGIHFEMHNVCRNTHMTALLLRVYPKVSGLSHKEINNKNNKHLSRSNTKGYGGKTH